MDLALVDPLNCYHNCNNLNLQLRVRDGGSWRLNIPVEAKWVFCPMLMLVIDKVE